MKELIALNQLREPYLHFFPLPNDRIEEVIAGFEADSDTNYKNIIIDGGVCQNVDDLFKEFSNKFQFPQYFGQNWAAFDECINDLDWIPATSYISIILNADLLLINSQRGFEIFLKILDTTIREWTEGRNYDSFPTQPTPFHVVFQCNPDQLNKLENRFLSCGREVKGDQIINL